MSTRTDRAAGGVVAQASEIVDGQALFGPAESRILFRAAAALLRPASPTHEQAAALAQLEQGGEVERRYVHDLRQLEDDATLPASAQRIVGAARRLLTVVSDRPPEPPEDPELTRELAEATAALEAAKQAYERVRERLLENDGDRLTFVPQNDQLAEANEIMVRAARRLSKLKGRERARRTEFHALLERGA